MSVKPSGDVSDLTSIASLASEIGNTYVGDEDRFVVSLIVGYGREDGVTSAERAVAAALDLTREVGAGDTQWHVYDRATGRSRIIEQSDAEALSMD